MQSGTVRNVGSHSVTPLISASGERCGLRTGCGQARKPVACSVSSGARRHASVTTFLVSKFTTTVEKRVVSLHKPWSKSDAFYRVAIDGEDFSNPFSLSDKTAFEYTAPPSAAFLPTTLFCLGTRRPAF